MKKTIITLLAFTSVAFAAEAVRVNPGESNAYTIPSDGKEYQLNLGGDNVTDTLDTFYITTTGDVSISKTDAYTSGNLAGTTIDLTLGGVMTISGVWGNLFQKNMTHRYDFGTTGKMVGQNQNNAQVQWKNNSATFDFSATLSTAELNLLNAGKAVNRTLISVGYFALDQMSLSQMANAMTLTLSGASLNYGGCLYSVTSNGNTTYYNISDVTYSGNHGTLSSTATAVELAKGTYYTVFGATSNSGASLKTISYVATIPEPTTATLSLLALAGLAARRRRK